MTKNAKENAKKLFENFTGQQLDDVEYVLEIPDDLVLFEIGRLDGVMYTTVRDGKKEKYLHEFSRGCEPVLASTSEGNQLFIVGGSYQFTESGIEDL